MNYVPLPGYQRVKPVWRNAANHGDVMISIWRFGEKPAPWFENTVHFLEHSVRVGNVFKNVVCEYYIETAIGIRNRLA